MGRASSRMTSELLVLHAGGISSEYHTAPFGSCDARCCRVLNVRLCCSRCGHGSSVDEIAGISEGSSFDGMSILVTCKYGYLEVALSLPSKFVLLGGRSIN